MRKRRKFPEDMKIMEDKVMNTAVEMCARLSTNSIKLGDIMSLSEGDVLVFDHQIEHDILASLGGLDIFEWVVAGRALGQPGQEGALGQV